ncbi:MAG: DUF2795 domain-containing protein [Actinomycetota bacterium]|nr:DUF2795 domain-containing protein [Actinomycetota bacterium]
MERGAPRTAFPARPDRLVETVRSAHGPDRVVALLERLPPEDEFENVQGVWEALGGRWEHRY